MQSPGPLVVPIDNATVKKATFYCCSTVAAYKTPPEGQATITGKMLGSPLPPFPVELIPMAMGLLGYCFHCSYFLTVWSVAPEFVQASCWVCFAFCYKKGPVYPQNPVFSLFVLSNSFSFLKHSDDNFSVLWFTRNLILVLDFYPGLRCNFEM
jgi:hypothetical protein